VPKSGLLDQIKILGVKNIDDQSILDLPAQSFTYALSFVNSFRLTVQARSLAQVDKFYNLL